MNKLKAGVRLSVKRDDDLLVQEFMELERLKMGRFCSIIYATYFDAKGVSVYIKRGDGLPDLHAFLPNGGFTNWRSWFDINGFEDANNAYIGTMHASKIFPYDCV